MSTMQRPLLEVVEAVNHNAAVGVEREHYPTPPPRLPSWRILPLVSSALPSTTCWPRPPSTLGSTLGSWC